MNITKANDTSRWRSSIRLERHQATRREAMVRQRTPAAGLRRHP